MKKKVVIGMSGGVDSSVAAYILKQQGYDVIGVTMQIWNDTNEYAEDNGGCCGLSAVDDARRVARKLDIPHFVLNFKKEFEEKVIDYFVEEYEQGKTPNPCIACNRYVKWESMLDKALQLGADYIATGHYGKIVEINGRYTLQIGKTLKKDQTYALYNLTQQQLKRTIMPLGDYTKEEVRVIAEKIDIDIAEKADSQEICFISDDNYGKFIEERGINIGLGNFIDEQGNILGKHKGIVHYTVGQRKGLGIAFGKPMYVKHINSNTKDITLCTNDNLFSHNLYASNLTFMAYDKFPTYEITAKIRYNHNRAKCRIEMIDKNKVKVIFNEPQRAITSGQAVVFYEGDIVIGGGVIYID